MSEIEERLNYQLDKQLEMNQYLETKCNILLAFYIGFVVAIISILKCDLLMYSMLGLIILPLLTLLMTFIPQTNLNKVENYTFYMDISNLTVENLKRVYGDDKKYNDSMRNSIINCAKISKKKTQLYNLSLNFFIPTLFLNIISKIIKKLRS